MHRRVWFLAAAAVVAVLALASSAAAMRTTTSSQSVAKSSFAKGLASVPRTPAARQAKKTVNFAMEQDAGGFNLANQDFTGAWAAYFGETPVIRGNYIINNKGKYILDLASKVKATKKSLSITIRKDANWNWIGHEPFPVTAADYIYTWKQIVKPGNNVASTVGYDQITRAKVTARSRSPSSGRSRSPTTRTCSATSTRRRRSGTSRSTRSGPTASAAIPTRSRSRTARTTSRVGRRAQA